MGRKIKFAKLAHGIQAGIRQDEKTLVDITDAVFAMPLQAHLPHRRRIVLVDVCTKNRRVTIRSNAHPARVEQVQMPLWMWAWLMWDLEYGLIKMPGIPYLIVDRRNDLADYAVLVYCSRSSDERALSGWEEDGIFALEVRAGFERYGMGLPVGVVAEMTQRLRNFPLTDLN
jgi:hypothetical protein